jgi:hypothetical protein
MAVPVFGLRRLNLALRGGGPLGALT